MKVIMAAPFEPKGRYAGGIMAIANSLLREKEFFKKNDIELCHFDTCIIQRSGRQGSLSFLNVKNALEIYKNLSKKIKESKADVLYFHTSVGFALLKDLLAIRRAKKQNEIKVIIHIHFAEYQKIVSKKWIEKIILNILKKYVDKIIFLSKETKEQFVRKGIAETKCEVIYNFSTLQIDPAKINFQRKEKLQFLFVGSICQRKGIFDILECLEKIDGDFVLNVCGEPLDSETKEKFDEYRERLGEKINFLGYVRGEEKEKVFADSDIFILPSYGEGMPIVILEAYSAGLAVISSQVGAIPEILTEKNGACIPSGDKETLYKVIKEYVHTENDKLAEQKKYNFNISKEFSIIAFIEKLIRICKE